MAENDVTIKITAVDDFTETIDKAVDACNRLKAAAEGAKQALGFNNISNLETHIEHIIAGINERNIHRRS